MRAISATQRICGRCRLHAQTTSPPVAAVSLAAVKAPAPRDPAVHQTRRFTQRPSLASPPPSSSSSSAAAAAVAEANTAPKTAPSPPQTLYSFFPQTLPDGPPPNGHFPINLRSLRAEFLRLQSRHHPDLHPASSKAQAEATSAAVNEAYKTLSNPLLRAQYLLSLQGVDVANDETLKVEEPELLTVVLEAHEAIEEARSPADLEGLTAENEERIRRCEEVLEEAFREHDLERAKREAVRLRYWVNVRGAVSDWEEGKPAVLQH
ncbi:putative chaperone [Metarhizium acridum CQMa 102]|uniref:Putative chaperone n=2 Tax=Metarhizium acridum TaxID=92637 RepID=E9EB24_METAQ|nr:putative chaperone [Metarhizium acridum CQMa 102]EFY86856.1 putative chaperone [Metarhizium acridum CQMa 102]